MERKESNILRDRIIEILEQNDGGTQPVYPLLHFFELYAQSQVNEAVSECIKLLVMFGSPNENKYLIQELKKLKR